MVMLVAPLLLVSTVLGHMAHAMPAAAGESDSATEPADYTTARRTGSGGPPGPRQGHHDLSSGIEWVTTCHQQGWWSLLLISSEHILPLLPAGFTLSPNLSILTWPEGYHPVLLETQLQSNCTEKAVPFLKTTFHEFKLELPFVVRQSTKGGIDGTELFMYKPLLYANTWTDVLGAGTVYGLNIRHASAMPLNSSYFAIEYDGGLFQTKFDSFGSEWVPFEKATVSDHMQVFRNMTSLPWLCKGTKQCAYNQYDWEGSARVRPVTAVIDFGSGVLPDLGADSLRIDGVNTTAYGCVQLDAMLEVSAVTDCPY